ncbi:MAG: peptide deformylase [Alphaproteobacteria bacterium]|nr:peptide deformylase [Alphaproteobacteria bacterium]
MAILKIARLGNPVLIRPADAIADPGHPEVRRLARDMVETMLDAPGVGLAAPQVHASLRLIVFHVPAPRVEAEAEPPPEGVTVLVNPTIEPLGDETVMGWEGCLSIPDLRGAVPRHRTIRYRGVDLEGQAIDRTVSGFHARVVQHEVDHLDGILYLSRMTDLSLLAFNDEWMRFMSERQP